MLGVTLNTANYIKFSALIVMVILRPTTGLLPTLSFFCMISAIMLVSSEEERKNFKKKARGDRKFILFSLFTSNVYNKNC